MRWEKSGFVLAANVTSSPFVGATERALPSALVQLAATYQPAEESVTFVHVASSAAAPAAIKTQAAGAAKRIKRNVFWRTRFAKTEGTPKRIMQLLSGHL